MGALLVGFDTAVGAAVEGFELILPAGAPATAPATAALPFWVAEGLDEAFERLTMLDGGFSEVGRCPSLTRARGVSSRVRAG